MVDPVLHLPVEMRRHFRLHGFPLLDEFVYDGYDRINTLLSGAAVHRRKELVDLGILRPLHFHHLCVHRHHLAMRLRPLHSARLLSEQCRALKRGCECDC